MKLKLSLIAATALFAVTQASAQTTINFDNLAAGSILSNQYASQGVVFSANAFSGAGSSSSLANWATNSDMTIVSAAGNDVGGLGNPSLVSGNLLRSFNRWLGEDGDASFLMTFSTPVTSVSVTFAGVNGALGLDTRLMSAAGATLVSGATGVANLQFVLTYSNPLGFSSIAVAPGSFDDWVGVDNVVFAPIPEPGTYALMALGLAGLLVARRRQR